MEYCDVGSLQEYMDMNNRLNEDEMREIASCCLLGIECLHFHNYSHGVMKNRSDY